MIDRDKSAVVVETALTQCDRQAEAVFLGLRMMDGFSVERYRELFGADIRETHATDLARFRDAGLIEVSGDLVKLTRAGALMSNEVFAAFV
jgi:oxygen-independent coproporphyrinogen-3 oxidase